MEIKRVSSSLFLPFKCTWLIKRDHRYRSRSFGSFADLRLYYKSIILLWERLHPSGIHLRHLPIFPETDAPPNSFQGQTLQCSEDLATSQTLQALISMLNVKVHERTIGNRLKKYALLWRVAGESLLFLIRMWQHSLGLQSCILTNHKTSNVFRTEESKAELMVIMAMKAKHNISAQTPPTHCNARWRRADNRRGLVLKPHDQYTLQWLSQTWTPLHTKVF